MGDKIDDSFDWLILIMSTMMGGLIGLPETLLEKKAMAGAVILPFFVLVMVWLLGHLIRRVRLKAILKVYAWFYALFMLEMFGVLFFDQIYGFMMILQSNVFTVFMPSVFLFLAFMFGGPFVFFDRLVRPLYKEIYKDSKLLSSRKRLALLYVFASVTFMIQILPSVLLGVFKPR
ncbi:MAG: hypothetical protein NTY03_01315 [Candidatus Bathyarchaeota archaeon]|nr:hypothetical protein [Candidatus Bathyarchaeota archaeon]